MIKARINSTGEVVEVRPYQTEKYDFMVCRRGSRMGELYMRGELTILGDNELDFISLVRRMREAQKDVVYKSVFSALDSARPTAYEVAKTKQIILEQEVDEYLKKMEE